MTDDTTRAKVAPATHPTGKTAGNRSKEDKGPPRPAAAAVEPTVDSEQYYSGQYFGRPLYRCPDCDDAGVTGDYVERHIAAVHTPPPAPTTAERASGAGIILPDDA